jgi:diguanylate cyclase (GGDEF)-like protein
MSTQLRIILTGQDPVFPPETLAPVAADGHAIESMDVAEFTDTWRPMSSPALVCFGLSRETAPQLDAVAKVIGTLAQVSFLAAVIEPADGSLWELARTLGIHAVVASNATSHEVRHRMAAASELRRLDDMAQLSANKLDRVRQTLQGFRHVDMDTGLSNRRALLQRLSDMLHLTQRYKRPLSLVVFHVTNHGSLSSTLDEDSLSLHYEELADELQLAQRASDLAARISTDVFALMLPETPHDGAVIVAERMVQTLEGRGYTSGEPMCISTGVVTSTDGETEARHVIHEAEVMAREGTTG